MSDKRIGPWKVQHSYTKKAYNIVGVELGSKFKIARVPYQVVVPPPEVSTDWAELNQHWQEEALMHAKLMSKAYLIPEICALLGKAYAWIEYPPIGDGREKAMKEIGQLLDKLNK